MSDVPIILSGHDLEDARHGQLLALRDLRRYLERFATPGVAAAGASMALIRARLVRHLRELVAALDRPVPQVERAGEATIAREAATLRTEAVKRIAELEA